MRKFILYFLLCGSVFICVYMLGVRFNFTSRSMPVGIYFKTDKHPETGDYVVSCLTQELADYGLEKGYLGRGFCATGIQPVLKKIIAVRSDKVVSADNSLWINGVLQEQYPVLDIDSNGRNIQLFYKSPYILKGNEYWLMSDYKTNSLDSRYWGAVPIEYVVKPVLIGR